jgi:hypothetical protein
MRTLIVLFICLGAQIVWADSLECSTDSKSTCYVSYVRYFPNGSDPYVRAKIHDPNNDTTCSYVTVRLNQGTSNLLVVRAIEALLITALTTGMPIQFVRLDAYGDTSDCFSNSLTLSSPGN